MVVTKVILPIALAIIMFGLGLGLSVADFRRVLVMPKPVLVGLFCQTVLLPLACYGIAVAFNLPPALAVGLMLLSASPGGATANIFSHLAHGDVALNITLTAVNSLLSLLTLPIIVGLSLQAFMSKAENVTMPKDKLIQTFLIILIPVGIGMLIRAKKPALSERLSKPVRTLAFVGLLLVIAGAVIAERARLGQAFQAVAIPALLFNLVSLGVGYLVPLGLKLPKKQAIAIGMEIGIHNGTLAIAVAENVLGNAEMALPPAIYSIIMFFTAGAFGLLVGRGMREQQAGEEAKDKEKPAPASAAGDEAAGP